MLNKLQKFVYDNRYTLILFLLLFFCIGDANAEIFGGLKTAGEKIAAGLEKVIYPAATIGIACVCIGGMFGNFNWKWLVAILLGVFIIAYAAQVGGIATGTAGADMNGAG
ncbi:MAG: TrbC/VirB2 family protein [Alphaproteobacteria bacterium]|nr:TrbC/VirB2 family protein [Alphaproteobacteria bacterium]